MIKKYFQLTEECTNCGEGFSGDYEEAPDDCRESFNNAGWLVNEKGCFCSGCKEVKGSE